MSEHDDRLLDELRGVARKAEPVPPDAIELGRAAFDLRTMDDELAELVADSLDEVEKALLVRSSSATVRLLSFELDDLGIELEVTHSGAGQRRVVGQLLPPAPCSLELRHRDGLLLSAADDGGAFVFEHVPGGPIRLVLDLGGGRRVATAWTVV